MGGAPMGARKALCKPQLALSETKLAQPPGSAAHPVQNSPCRPARRPTRYKTLPARPKTLISTHFSRAGRTFYRFRHQQPEQGELYPACRAASGTKLSPLAASAGDTGTKLSQQAALAGPPGTKLSQQAALTGPPGTKLSQRAPKRRFRPTFRMQGELCTASAINTTSREKKVTHQHPTSAQQRAPL